MLPGIIGTIQALETIKLILGRGETLVGRLVLFDALELKNLNLMGHSYGGWQASLYALAHPERLATLMLLAPAATVLPPPFGLIARALISYFIPTRFITKRSLYWYAPDAVDKANTRAPHLNLKLAAPPSIPHRVRTSRDPLRRRSARLQSAR